MSADPLRPPQAAPLVLFGAFDRHNFGDLLLGRIAAAQAACLTPGRPLRFAGLAARDLRADGGPLVEPVDAIARALRQRAAADPQAAPPGLLQVGGEILDCRAYEAAIMLMSRDEAARAIAHHDRDLAGRERWGQQWLGIARQLPYLASAPMLPPATRIVHAGVGGVGLAGLPRVVQAEACAALRDAALVQVRDQRTQAWLATAGIATSLAPDPATLVARVLGVQIAGRAGQGEAARIRARFPGGWIAAQLSAEFGDDATLDALAAGLDPLLRDSGLGLVLFCAGVAPWHDDPAVLHRLRDRLREPARCHVATTTHLLELCALLAGCTLCLASSLHARIVAEAFARPAASLVRAGAQGDKLRAYLETWHAEALHLHDITAGGPIRAAQAAQAERAAKRDARAARLAGLAADAAGRYFAALDGR
ncbi:polysaccharide pyruvyl transferase family protein [Thauera sp.]|uniref:polysaccharide pyruvyl transferase family protein n=1 Tax=Thauera sp. TaxID=1905334 RepID=UPI002BEEDE54|nr:polysaccharide pyruvyl transferase family protein [Thauera sp.]HRP24756.1 polysaccharide pyruvyl transferase family protein [Thauera sp.]